MKVQVIPTLKRFIETSTGGTAGRSGAERTRRRGKDFMTQDLTGSARRYAR